MSKYCTLKQLQQVTAGDQEIVRVISNSSCSHQQEKNKCYIYYYTSVCINEPAELICFLAVCILIDVSILYSNNVSVLVCLSCLLALR